MRKALVASDTINVTLAGHMVTWVATRALTLSTDGRVLLDEIIVAHQEGALLPVLPPKPNWCERMRQWFLELMGPAC